MVGADAEYTIARLILDRIAEVSRARSKVSSGAAPHVYICIYVCLYMHFLSHSRCVFINACGEFYNETRFRLFRLRGRLFYGVFWVERKGFIARCDRK